MSCQCGLAVLTAVSDETVGSQSADPEAGGAAGTVSELWSSMVPFMLESFPPSLTKQETEAWQGQFTFPRSLSLGLEPRFASSLSRAPFKSPHSKLKVMKILRFLRPLWIRGLCVYAVLFSVYTCTL